MSNSNDEKDSLFYTIDDSDNKTSNDTSSSININNNSQEESSSFEVNLAKNNPNSISNDDNSQRMNNDIRQQESGLTREEAIKQNHKDDHTKIFAKLVYWVSLFAAIIGNFIATVILVPFIVMLESKLILYLIIMVLGVVFGALFSFLLLDLSKLDKNNHVVSGAVIPALALINVYIMVEISKAVGIMLDMNINRNSITISIIYVCMFVLPYVLGTIYKNYLKSK